MNDYWKNVAQAQSRTIRQLERERDDATRELRDYRWLCAALCLLIIAAGWFL